MALGCLRDDTTTTNDNPNRRRHQILSACGGFLFSRKSVARRALHPFFSKTPHFPLNQIKLPLRRSPSQLVKRKGSLRARNPPHVMPLAEGDKESICHPLCALVLASTIGGTSMGSYAALGAMELDSHANMAVAGSNCNIIATSGHYANVTPFFSNLPTMDMVEIRDALIAYDNPILHVTTFWQCEMHY